MGRMVPFVTHLKQFLVQSMYARVKVVVVVVVAVSPGTYLLNYYLGRLY